jgi:hypothetical protein
MTQAFLFMLISRLSIYVYDLEEQLRVKSTFLKKNSFGCILKLKDFLNKILLYSKIIIFYIVIILQIELKKIYSIFE